MAREIIFYKNYFLDFYDGLGPKDQEKIDFVLELIRTVDRVPAKFLKHIEGTAGLFEIRIYSRGNIFRVFCCFDQDKLVVLFNGFQKKSMKTPRSEIDHALKLQKKYFTS